MTAVAGDPASCSQLGGALRRIAAELRTSGEALHREVVTFGSTGERPPPVVQRSRRRAAALDDAAAAAARELDAAGTALQGHAADLGEAVAAVRDLTEQARSAGLRVSDTEVSASWGVTGLADSAASAARDDRRIALQAELDQTLTVLAHRRGRLATTLQTAADTLARQADELRR
jgi:hypothetical protein